MSRVGKEPINIPDGVTLTVADAVVTAKGKFGELATKLSNHVDVNCVDNQVKVSPTSELKRAREMWGTTRSNINNLILGVSQGFQKSLELNGVGYRAQIQGKELVMQLGLSHDIRYPIPEGIKIECSDQTAINVSGADKQQVGQVAAEIRAFRPPEPYKGKGVKYIDEYIFRKEGKKK